MKVCFFGLGSIGQRHLKNFIKLSKEYNLDVIIDAFRSSQKSIPVTVEDKINKVITRYSELGDYDIIFITNPTSEHFKIIEKMSLKAKHMFIEKPVFHTSKCDIDSLKLNSKSIYYVACPTRFDVLVDEMKKIVETENILSSRIIASSYLPDWRKGVDYRTVYSAQKDLGGGVRKDLIHEIDLVMYLFGFPQNIKSVSSRVSDLEIDVEDVTQYILEYNDKLISIHIDYIGRSPLHEMELITNKETYRIDFLTHEIHCMKLGKIIKKSDEDVYMREMDYFIKSVLSESKTFNELEYAVKVLKYCEGEM